MKEILRKIRITNISIVDDRQQKRLSQVDLNADWEEIPTTIERSVSINEQNIFFLNILK
jgi:hypothetical protein